METGNHSEHKGLGDISRNSDDVARYYDDWANDYDENLGEWHYEAPEQVAVMLMADLRPESLILDAGCGTGFSGRALRSSGFQTVDGINED